MGVKRGTHALVPLGVYYLLASAPSPFSNALSPSRLCEPAMHGYINTMYVHLWAMFAQLKSGKGKEVLFLIASSLPYIVLEREEERERERERERDEER